MTTLPAAGPRSKANNRTALVRDADYFAGALIHRLERLAQLDGRRSTTWKQCAILARRVRQQTGQALENPAE